MTSSVFVDANVPIYATGADAALAGPSIEILRASRFAPGLCVTDAETLQEILYVMLRRGLRDRGRETIAAFDAAMNGGIEPVLREDVLRAAAYDFPPALQARDRVHVAVMERLGVRRVISADAAYDAVPGIERLDPRTIATWRESVFGSADR